MGDHGGGSRKMKSDETLFSIIEYLREADGCGVTEIADNLDIAKSTAHGHLAAMRDHGFVTKEGDTYHLGLQFFNYGQYVRAQFRVYKAAKSAFDELAASTGEMVWLFAHEAGRVMYLYGNTGGTDVNEESVLGSWANMHCNSAGKAILAHLPDSKVEEILDRHGLPQRTTNTITDRDELHEELDRVREQGYALNLGEDIEGIHAIGVPLVFEERIRGAISVAGPAHRVTKERCESEIADQLFALTDDIELNLAFS